MFPDIYAGHIIAIDGPKWLVTMRLPDAFVLTELGEGNHRTIKLPFEDLERIRAAGFLSIEGPLTPHVPEANADVPKLGAHRAADNDDRCRSGGDDPA